jgi:hypothetical protein
MRKVIKGGDVNFSSYPDTFSSSDGQVPGVGCSGTKNNALAAAGKFSQNGGYYSFGEPIGSSFGSSGTGMIQVNNHPTVVRPMNVFPKRFTGLSGGKQIGCRMTKKGGKKHRKSTNRRKGSKHRRTTNKRSGTSKHSGTSKRSGTSKHRRATRKHRSLRIKRGGDGPQPYSNIPISFSQTFNKTLSAGNSALATPTPLSPVSNCPYN